MSDCIFCKLANGEIPTNTIYEDDLFNVFLDADPATKGHALIVPKAHYNDLFELGDTEKKALLDVAAKVAAKQKEALGCQGVNLVQNNGEVAGQTVMHFHMHVIPRYIDQKDPTICGWSHETFTAEEMQDIRAKLNM